jgi:hypothetical protein
MSQTWIKLFGSCFHESKHASTALQVIQDSLASPTGSSSNKLKNFLVLVPLLFQAGLEVRISRYTIRLLESQLHDVANVDKAFWILGGEAKGTWAFSLRRK